MKTSSSATLIVMGVSGVGKTVVAKALSAKIHAIYVEADEFHPEVNIAAMRSGTPLTDDMRQPWLLGIAAEIKSIQRRNPGKAVVVACSSLKRSYRDILRLNLSNAKFVYLSGDKSLISQRLAQRRDHFMPPTLLDSQLATLEPPAPDERHIEIDASHPKEKIVTEILAALEPQLGDCPKTTTNTQ